MFSPAKSWELSPDFLGEAAEAAALSVGWVLWEDLQGGCCGEPGVASILGAVAEVSLFMHPTLLFE